MQYTERRNRGKSKNRLSLNDRLSDWIGKVVRHPRFNIVLPWLILTIFSYHTFSNLTIGWPSSGYITKIQPSSGEFVMVNDSDSLNLTMVQIMVRSIDEDDNILTKKSLLEFMAFQNKLVDGLAQNVTVNSIFKIWNNSLDVLYEDNSPLQTINAKRLSIPPFSLLGTWKINGFISSAAGCMISLLTEVTNLPDVQSLLQRNIAYLNSISNVTTFHILEPQEGNLASSMEAIQTVRVFLLKISKKWNIATLLVCSALIVHFIMSMNMLKNSLKSVIGMSAAMMVQITLVLASSLTVTELLFKRSNDVIPVRLLCWPVALFLINSHLRLMESLSDCDARDDHFNQHVTKGSSSNTHLSISRLSEIERGFITSLSRSQSNSLKSLLVLSAVMVLFIPFSIKATHFMLFAMWMGEFLNCTLFTAIMSLDFKGREDSILRERSDSDHLLFDDNVASKFRSLRYKDIFRVLSSRKFTIVLIGVYLLACNLRFSPVISSASWLSNVFTHTWSEYMSVRNSQPKVALDQRFVAERAFFINRSNNARSLVVDLIIRKALSVIQSEDTEALENLSSNGSQLAFDMMSSDFFYKLDFTYALQFVTLIVLVLSCTLLGLQKLLDKPGSNKIDLFSGLNFEPASDILLAKKTDELSAGSEVNKSENHIHEDHFHMKELYKGGHGLDITTIATSKAPFVVSAGLDHKVFVWSPLMNPVPAPTKIPLERRYWPLSKVIMSNDGNYIAFFGSNGNITTWSRRHMKFIWDIKLKDLAGEKTHKVDLLESLFRKVTVPAFKKKRLQSSAKQTEVRGGRHNVISPDSVPVVMGGLDASYENPKKLSAEYDDINELVFVTSAGLIYSIRDDGAMQVGKLTPSEHGLISCRLLSSPRVNDRLVTCDEIGDIYIATVINNKWRPNKLKVNYNRILKPPTAACELTTLSDNNAQDTTATRVTDNTIELVQFVGLLVRVLGRTADLIDAQTGIVVKRFAIDCFKPNTLRVFHDSPTHCKFCGSASVASFSIAYTDAESGRVTMHTYKLESRTKTSICLRVERDLREIRCLGMESAVETVHYLYDAEDWCVTDSNMLIGMRKVPQVLESSKTGSSSMTRTLSDDEVGLQQRKKSKYEGSDLNSESHLIHNIWEGWSMSANGKILFHKIPVGVTGLVTDRLGPLTQFGAKAIVVGLANIMDMFYVGSEDLIFSTETGDGSKEETSLRFVNNRRDRLSHKRIPLNYGNLG